MLLRYLFLAFAILGLAASSSPGRRMLAPESRARVRGPAWRLVWSDEFNGDSLDESKWQIQPGLHAGGHGELQTYTADRENISVDSGVLRIAALQSRSEPGRYTSGRIRTLGHAAWTYGRFEARIKIPPGRGTWPVFWIMGADLPRVGWPACGEVDIMEAIGRRPDVIFGTAHGPGFASPGIGAPYHIPSGRFADQYHVFALEWDPGELRWEVDGVTYNVLLRQDLKGTWVFDKPFFIELNLGVGGAWSGNPDHATAFPQAMLVDYVRVYQRATN